MATVTTLVSFAKAHGATAEKALEISRNGKFVGIRCLDGTYLNFAKNQFGENMSHESVMLALKEAKNLDVIEGVSEMGNVCYTIIRHTELPSIEWDSISF